MNNILQVVSMLLSKEALTLITAEAAVVKLSHNERYDTNAIANYLTANLKGTNIVPLDTSEYTLLSTVLEAKGYDSKGIITVMEVDGEQVEGIFYRKSVSVNVMVDNEPVTIPNVEHLTNHISRASKENSPSVREFLLRLAPVIKARKHSGEDLMEFIERSDLPLTDNGMIIAYKRVNIDDIGFDDVIRYKDCHTGKIIQQVGSKVTMPVDLVDPNRNNSCSVGLHVANLDYMRHFTGTATLIVLVDPADFIAVPTGETTKARVASYTIIGAMSDDAHGQVSQGSHAEDRAFEMVISDAVAGKHLQPFEEIFVEDQKISRVESLIAEPAAQAMNLELQAPKPSGKSLRGTQVKQEVNIAAVRAAKQLTPPRFTQSTTTLFGQINALYADWAANPSPSNYTAILEFRKAKKKSFAKLGLTEAQIKELSAAQE